MSQFYNFPARCLYGGAVPMQDQSPPLRLRRSPRPVIPPEQNNINARNNRLQQFRNRYDAIVAEINELREVAQTTRITQMDSELINDNLNFIRDVRQRLNSLLTGEFSRFRDRATIAFDFLNRYEMRLVQELTRRQRQGCIIS